LCILLNIISGRKIQPSGNSKNKHNFPEIKNKYSSGKYKIKEGKLKNKLFPEKDNINFRKL